MAAACIRRSRTYGSCLQQPTRTVRIGHGSPPFQRTTLCRPSGASFVALPNRRELLFEGDCRSGLRRDSRRDWDAGLSLGGGGDWPCPSGPLLPAAGLLLPATPC